MLTWDIRDDRVCEGWFSLDFYWQIVIFSADGYVEKFDQFFCCVLASHQAVSRDFLKRDKSINVKEVIAVWKLFIAFKNTKFRNSSIQLNKGKYKMIKKLCVPDDYNTESYK
jgi:hypothetical protein